MGTSTLGTIIDWRLKVLNSQVTVIYFYLMASMSETLSLFIPAERYIISEVEMIQI
jgi:hypothetical protein